MGRERDIWHFIQYQYGLEFVVDNYRILVCFFSQYVYAVLFMVHRISQPLICRVANNFCLD